MKFRCALLLFVVLISCSDKHRIVVGSKNFSEQVILGELLAQYIEGATGVPVERKLNLGGTFVCHKAMTAGELDLYVEYTGTALTAILKRPPRNDPGAVYQEVKQAYHDQFHLEWTEPLGFNNTFAIIIRGEEARRLGIKTISQSAQHTPQWKAGFGYEFMERKDGFPGLAQTYGLKFANPPRVMDLTLTYRAAAEKQVDFIAGNSTDGVISKLDLVVLEDDKHYFPPYEAAPVVREEALQKTPGLREALKKLGGMISEDQMRKLNYQVDVEHKDVKQVVKEYIKNQIKIKNQISNKHNSINK